MLCILCFGLNLRRKSPVRWPSQVFWGRTWSVRSSAQLPTSWRRRRAPPSTWPSTVSTAVHTPSYFLSFSSLLTETETEPHQTVTRTESENPKNLDNQMSKTRLIGPTRPAEESLSKFSFLKTSHETTRTISRGRISVSAPYSDQ